MTTSTITTLGEALVVFYPEPSAPLSTATHFATDVGGAELNVATSTARMGVATSWLSRLGADGFGDRVLATAHAAGVDTSGVERDDEHPTGIYLKEPRSTDAGDGSRVQYHRSDSAAAAMTPGLLVTPAATGALSASIVHVSGITAALSDGAAATCARLRTAIRPDALLSVDLNHRPVLWGDRPTGALDDLVGLADLLFVGRDEAEAYFGHADPARLFAAFPALRRIVVKDDVRAAVTHDRDGGSTEVPCLRVDVVEAVGAGDAFAAGYLTALAEGRPEAARLRLGHAVAALALTSPGDRPTRLPDGDARDAIADASPDAWRSWRVDRHSTPWETRRP